MNCHPPTQFYDTHISLYYRGFDEFLQNCESLDIGQDDVMFTTTICCLMSKAYEAEMQRMETVFQNTYIKNYINVGTSFIQLCLRQIDASITIKDHPILIIEAKDEVGKGGCDS